MFPTREYNEEERWSFSNLENPSPLLPSKFEGAPHPARGGILVETWRNTY